MNEQLQVIVYPDGAMEAVNPALVSECIAEGGRVANEEEEFLYWEGLDSMDRT